MPSTRGAIAPILTLLGLCCCTAGPPHEAQAPAAAVEPAAKAPARNPFGVDDVPDCCGDAARTFGDEVPARGTADDVNAEAWVTPPAGPFDSIEGEWAGRWDTGGPPWTAGRARIRVVAERVFISYRDDLIP